MGARLRAPPCLAENGGGGVSRDPGVGSTAGPRPGDRGYLRAQEKDAGDAQRSAAVPKLLVMMKWRLGC